jgi:uracil-DNA glycosylase
MNRLLESLGNEGIKLILFGNMAKDIKKHLTCSNKFFSIQTLHPYNVGFIYDLNVQDFFKPMRLLYKSVH